MSITLIDYGIGNLLSVERAFRHIGADFKFARTAAEIKAADKMVLPGVGAFTSCTSELDKRGLSDSIREFVASERPLLGICVGMQMLFETSEEFGIHPGFGFLKGSVKAIPASATTGKPHKIPHIGWTALNVPASRQNWNNTIMQGIQPGAEVYFVHSFTAHPGNDADRLADSQYGGQPLSAAVSHDNISGVQFHPEKSGSAGLRILENFLKL